MRTLLSRIGPRYGVGLGLIVAVAIVLAFARAVGNGHGTSLETGGSPGPIGVTVSGPPDDGEGTTPTPAAPSTSPGADSPRTVATRFAQVWLHHDVSAAQWHANVSRYTTRALSDELNGADPAGVPADRVVGAITQIDVGADFCQIEVPTDTGTLTLSLRADSGRWLVSGIDWTPS